MMGLLNILKNTVEGTVGTVVNIAVAPIKAVADMEDGLDEAMEEIVKNIKKLGSDE